MKITDVITMGWKGCSEEFELPLPHSEERFLEYFELNGKIMICPEGIQKEYDNTYHFYCGPAEDYNAVSGVIYISNEYLGGVCKELGIDVFLHDSENYHRLNDVKSYEDAMEQFNRIKVRISQDFEIDRDRY
tara:strand:- start:1357 stop:1752 length:396 start_codon:yes stop_codon:yes gene_type:complete